jgi:beta-galactosidase
MNIKGRWRTQFDIPRARMYTCDFAYFLEPTETEFSVSMTGIFASKAKVPLFELTITYKFDANGLHTFVDAKQPAQAWIEQIPRFAMQIETVNGFEDLEYFAKGPRSCYTDIQNHAYHSIFRSTVTDEAEELGYMIMPQEVANHVDTTYVSLSSANDTIRVDGNGFEFSALHYSIEDLEKAEHNWELTPSAHTYLLINYKVCGLGSNSCGHRAKAPFAFTEKEFTFAFDLTIS